MAPCPAASRTCLANRRAGIIAHSCIVHSKRSYSEALRSYSTQTSVRPLLRRVRTLHHGVRTALCTGRRTAFVQHRALVQHRAAFGQRPRSTQYSVQSSVHTVQSSVHTVHCRVRAAQCPASAQYIAACVEHSTAFVQYSIASAQYLVQSSAAFAQYRAALYSTPYRTAQHSYSTTDPSSSTA